MTRFVFITQVVDPEHPALGATVAKICALAERVDEVVVLALEAVPGALPSNCRVLEFGAPSRPGRVARFVSSMTAASRPRPTAVLAHMAPVYAVLAAPWCRPRRVPLLLWYTHWHATTMLRVATVAVDAVVSVDRRSFPLESEKVVAIGHGIDVDAFTCADRVADPGRLALLSLGRYSPAKGLETVIRAVALVPGAELAHHGPALTPEEAAHRKVLDRLVSELDLGARVALEGPLPRHEIADRLVRADALVNNMRAGATDKVVYEAAASCLPVFASNPAFDGFLPPSLRFPRDDPEALAARLRDFDALDAPRIGAQLRAQVEHGHSTAHWGGAVLDVASSVRR